MITKTKGKIMELKLDVNRIRTNEKLGLTLKSIYESYGYTPYKMSKFEEYELYARNKDFLGDGGILTFTDVSGRLMALKPDVTLSIVKNSMGAKGTQKVFYHENVYRTSKHRGSFKELEQSGIECIGDIGHCDIIEVLLLAIKSLEATGHPFKLEISHMGILSCLMDKLSLCDADRQEAISCIKHKNAHGINEIAQRNGINEPVALSDAIALNGSPKDVISALTKMVAADSEAYEALKELSSAFEALDELGYGDNVGIDLSVVNDMNYYRSLVFRGYVDKIPEGVLFGGRYDELVRKMGRSCSAIGFAVSLDKLSELSRNERAASIDVMLVYGEKTPFSVVYKTCEDLRQQGMTVIALSRLDTSIRATKTLYLKADGTVSERTEDN